MSPCGSKKDFYFIIYEKNTSVSYTLIIRRPYTFT